jgi:hypothetical protein
MDCNILHLNVPTLINISSNQLGIPAAQMNFSRIMKGVKLEFQRSSNIKYTNR